MENDLYELVFSAQHGDMEAVASILSLIYPSIQNALYKVKSERQDDLKQDLIETLIKKILTYDLSKIPSFTTFIHQLK